jgi:hypothetical protein
MYVATKTMEAWAAWFRVCDEGMGCCWEGCGRTFGTRRSVGGLGVLAHLFLRATVDEDPTGPQLRRPTTHERVGILACNFDCEGS